MEAISGLERSASEHVDQLQATPVNSGDASMADTASADEQEEDFDETLSTEESMIKDFSAMFDDDNE